MLKLLLGILIFFGLILMLAGAFGVKMLRSLFGFGNKPSQQPRTDETYTPGNDNRDKIFGEHEGEYVEFEEIEEKHED